MAAHTWNLLLAGGRGTRLAGVTGGVPKQFWSPEGDRTLLDQTLERLAPFAPPGRTVVVVDRQHEPFVKRIQTTTGHVLYQPEDRGTAAGVLLALLPILDADPDAAVIMSPADHGVLNPLLFGDGLRTAIRHVRRRRAGIVLFGAEPLGFDGSYGWILPGPPAAARLCQVDGFVEKPGPSEAAGLLASGAVWNTMVLVAGVRSLRELFACRAPGLTSLIEHGWRAPEWARSESLAAAYAGLGPLDFSRDVLTGAEGLVVYTWPASMGWSDLGTPDRLSAWLDIRRPACTRETSTSAA